jgi:hypothetical protein
MCGIVATTNYDGTKDPILIKVSWDGAAFRTRGTGFRKGGVIATKVMATPPMGKDRTTCRGGSLLVG